MIAVSLLLACVEGGSGQPADVASSDSGAADGADGGRDTARDTADSGRDTARDTADADGLRGVRIDPPLAPPTFAVLDQHGQQRTESDLVGHPTVLWFFREAEGST